jgi:hypothetical protein
MVIRSAFVNCVMGVWLGAKATVMPKVAQSTTCCRIELSSKCNGLTLIVKCRNWKLLLREMDEMRYAIREMATLRRSAGSVDIGEPLMIYGE